jgi:hypothetical protein
MVGKRRTQPPRPPAGPPASAKDGAAAVIAAAVKLFDRQDGKGVDPRMMAETLFFAAFNALDGLPEDQRHTVAKSVHAGAYRRFSGADADEFAASKTGQGEMVSAPSNTADFKSSGPGPENGL